MSELVNVVAVEIKSPHARRILAERLTEADAGWFIKMAITRRGVEHEFYTTEPASPKQPGAT